MSRYDIPIKECGDPLVDVRRQGGLLYGPPPECPETAPDYCLLRAEVYRKLLRVEQSLPAGCRLRLYEGLRSLSVQGMLFAQEKERVKARHPHLPPEEIHAEATNLVAPVMHWNGSRNTPPHSTGGAVDIEIVDGEGAVIDFGMEAKDWWLVTPEFCAPQCASLSPVAAANRRLLAEAMTREGFVNHHNEWWHFSYGDQYWAYRSGQEHAIYGACSPEMIRAATA